MILKPAKVTQAFLKEGIYGKEGSGKTLTATLHAIGLHRYIKSEKPVAFFDTETGSDFVLHMFATCGIEVLSVKSHSLKTLGEAMREAQTACDVMIIDSLTHIYKDLLSSYLRKKTDGTHFIRIQDWQPIKDAWAREFANPYVNMPMHIIWCARAKNIFEDVVDEMATEQSGRDQFKSVVVGTGARAESESAYEPSVLIEMERVMQRDGGKYARRATVLKERFNLLTDEQFEYPTVTTDVLLKENKPFTDLLPHIKMLNLGGEHMGFTDEGSEDLFEDERDEGLIQIRKRRKIALEKINTGFKRIFPAGTGKDPVHKIAAMECIFATTSETELEGLPVETLESGVQKLRDLYRFAQTDTIKSADQIKTFFQFDADDAALDKATG